MNAKIRYRLSVTGQKAAILAGRSATAEQVIAVAVDDPSFPDLLEVAEIDASGNVALDLMCNRPRECEPEGPILWDHLPAAAELIADLKARRERKSSQVADAKAAIRAESLAVLAERRTIVRREDSVYVPESDAIVVPVLAPGWPYPFDESVANSPEGIAWAAELDVVNQAARKAADDKRAVIVAEIEVRQKQEQAAEQARREAAGLKPGDEDFDIVAGALTEIPAGMWESHKRGKNWCATITMDPTQPAGLARSFLDKAKGESFYLVPSNLHIGQAIEFGADYYSGRGSKSANRWYGYVVSISAERLVLHKCETAKTAVNTGAAVRLLAEQPAL